MATSVPYSGYEYEKNEGVIKGDKLVLRGLMFFGFHGMKAEEKTLGQKFLVDIDAWMNLRVAGESDKISDTVDNFHIYQITKSIIEGQPHELLESLAEFIASNTLENFSKIYAIRVKVMKPHVAVSGPVDYFGVEILRQRKH